MVIRRRYIFEGRVQGVGFRYTTRYHAQLLGLTGWVENLYDGSVMAEVQGEHELIDKLIRLLHEDSYIRITSIRYKNIAVDPNETSFNYKFGY